VAAAGRRDMSFPNPSIASHRIASHRFALPCCCLVASDRIAWHTIDPAVLVRVAYTRDGLTPPSPPARMEAAGETVCETARLGQEDDGLGSFGVSEVCEKDSHCLLIRVTGCSCAYTNETCNDTAPANPRDDHTTTRSVHVSHSTHPSQAAARSGPSLHTPPHASPAASTAIHR
jgi:hypothetical protein